MSLKKLRRDIDRIDKQVLSFLNRRAALTIQIGKLKEKFKLLSEVLYREEVPEEIYWYYQTLSLV